MNINTTLIMSKPGQKPTPIKQQRQKFDPDLYEKCVARYLIIRGMLRLGDVQQAKAYLEAIPDYIHAYSAHLCDPAYDDDPRPLKLLVRFCYGEVEFITHPKPANGKHWGDDRKYYLNQMMKYGW